MEQVNIPLEAELKIQLFAMKVNLLSLDESHKLLIELYSNSIVKEVLYKELLKKKWGLEAAPTLSLAPSQPYEFPNKEET